MQNCFFAFTFDQLKDRLVARRVMSDFQTLPRQFGYNFFDCSRLMQLYQSAASAGPVYPGWRFAKWQQFLAKLGVEQIQVQVLLVKFEGCRFVGKIISCPTRPVARAPQAAGQPGCWSAR